MIKTAVIKENIVKFEERVGRAAIRSGRVRGDITVVAVTKGVSPEVILEVAGSGLSVFGENRVQEAELKIPQVPAQWHMIGHLQSNKVKTAVSLFSMIQSVDSVRLAQKINDEALAQNKVMPVLLEVNVSLEAQKYGFSSEEIYGAIDQIAQLPRIEVRGLMGISADTPDSDRRRAEFRKLKGLFGACKSIKHERLKLQTLSMGMSDDFEIAIEEGSTMIRVGRVLFK